MTLEEYKQSLRERIKVAEAATDGPWLHTHIYAGEEVITKETEVRGKQVVHHITTLEDQLDGRFIAQAGTHYLADLKALLAAVEALEGMSNACMAWVAPEKWDHAGMGGPPSLEHYEAIDVGEVARAALEKITNNKRE